MNANVRYELDLRERSIRVEGELKHQRELMVEGFKQMDKRFEMVQLDMNKRFEMIQLDMNKRFEQVDKRFEQMDKRIEQVDKHIEQVQLDMNKRFEQVDRRFEQQHQEVMGLHHEIKLLMRWSFGTMLAIGGLIVAILRLAH